MIGHMIGVENHFRTTHPEQKHVVKTGYPALGASPLTTHTPKSAVFKPVLIERMLLQRLGEGSWNYIFIKMIKKYHFSKLHTSSNFWTSLDNRLTVCPVVVFPIATLLSRNAWEKKNVKTSL